MYKMALYSTLLVLTAYLVIWTTGSSNSAMIKCQETHSFETCHHTLNR